MTAKPGDIWDDYRAEDTVHARLPVYRSRITTARLFVAEWLARCERPYVAVSGGKDSVAMLHLIQSVARRSRGLLPVLWHDSGVEWPGVADVFERLRAIDLIDELVIVRPLVDVLELKRQQLAGRISMARKDRLAMLDPIKLAATDHGFDAVALGLRKEESKGRLLDGLTRGAIYRRKSGLLRCIPLVGWKWQDVFAYIAQHRLPLHPIYSAPLQQLEHRGRIRLSWWASTDHYRHGEVQWVRRVYPDIYAQLVAALPGAARLS